MASQGWGAQGPAVETQTQKWGCPEGHRTQRPSFAPLPSWPELFLCSSNQINSYFKSCSSKTQHECGLPLTSTLPECVPLNLASDTTANFISLMTLEPLRGWDRGFYFLGDPLGTGLSGLDSRACQPSGRPHSSTQAPLLLTLEVAGAGP